VTPPRRQQHAPPGRADHDHVADRRRTGHRETEILEQSYAAWPDQVATRLVAPDSGLVDDRDASTASREHERGNTASRTRPDHDHVVFCLRQ
jgi:hypothetical protein